jgi:hypothetical protein
MLDIMQTCLQYMRLSRPRWAVLLFQGCAPLNGHAVRLLAAQL